MHVYRTLYSGHYVDECMIRYDYHTRQTRLLTIRSLPNRETAIDSCSALRQPVGEEVLLPRWPLSLLLMDFCYKMM